MKRGILLSEKVPLIILYAFVALSVLLGGLFSLMSGALSALFLVPLAVLSVMTAVQSIAAGDEPTKRKYAVQIVMSCVKWISVFVMSPILAGVVIIADNAWSYAADTSAAARAVLPWDRTVFALIIIAGVVSIAAMLLEILTAKRIYKDRSDSESRGELPADSASVGVNVVKKVALSLLYAIAVVLLLPCGLYCLRGGAACLVFFLPIAAVAGITAVQAVRFKKNVFSRDESVVQNALSAAKWIAVLFAVAVGIPVLITVSQLWAPHGMPASDFSKAMGGLEMTAIMLASAAGIVAAAALAAETVFAAQIGKTARGEGVADR